MEQRLKILVLDDEPIVCERLKSSLEKLGFEAETFTDSREASRRISEKRFDIVVTDLKMEGLDGLDILKMVKERYPDTRVIIITGFATVDKAKEALKIGAYDFISKPFKLSKLRDLILKAAEETQSDSLKNRP